MGIRIRRWDGIDQSPAVGMKRRVEDLIAHAELHHPSEIKHQDPARDMPHY